MTKIAFVSTMDGLPWGGSEELWSRTALLLAKRGIAVAVSVNAWPETPKMLTTLRDAGCEVAFRRQPSVVQRVAGRLGISGSNWLDQVKPQAVIISQGGHYEGHGWGLECAKRRIPYALLAQAASERYWPTDEDIPAITSAYAQATAALFVSEGNSRLLETQLGARLPNASVVRNPFNVAYDISLPWPSESEGLRLACVARLEPGAKGQDILFQTLAADKWRNRALDVTLFGNGPNAQSLQALKTLYGLERVHFGGFRPDVASIWADHHALILPSRYEGLPLALVEAMLCARPGIVTDVAGNTELLEDGVHGFVAAAPAVSSLDAALERAWNGRQQWRQMGQAAAVRVRQLIPSDPIAAFADRVMKLA